MKLSVSNIAWSDSMDLKILSGLNGCGIQGLEIAPTRIFPLTPYSYADQARCWADTLQRDRKLCVPSMQSIWFGVQERLFGTEAERRHLIDYTKQAIEFAEAIHCHNLVFGCPRNRELADNENQMLAIPFFEELGTYAARHNTVIGMEANPPIYNTNFINTTAEALELIKTINNPGFRLNLDIGTMVYNNESIDILEGNIDLINHVHISEPWLKPIKKHSLHTRLYDFLKQEGYDRFVSLEMGKTEDIYDFQISLTYFVDTFGK